MKRYIEKVRVRKRKRENVGERKRMKKYIEKMRVRKRKREKEIESWRENEELR